MNSAAKDKVDWTARAGGLRLEVHNVVGGQSIPAGGDETIRIEPPQ